LQLADKLRLPQNEVQKEAQAILDEMAHSLNLKAVRGFAYFLIKIFKSLFQRIYVNEEGVRQLRKLIHEYPVLLMPTHRSYMDFLLISYIFYEYDLPLPVIAAAMGK
jgi:glycerone phosphate O-acyltransferase